MDIFTDFVEHAMKEGLRLYTVIRMRSNIKATIHQAMERVVRKGNTWEGTEGMARIVDYLKTFAENAWVCDETGTFELENSLQLFLSRRQ